MATTRLYQATQQTGPTHRGAAEDRTRQTEAPWQTPASAPHTHTCPYTTKREHRTPRVPRVALRFFQVLCVSARAESLYPRTEEKKSRTCQNGGSSSDLCYSLSIVLAKSITPMSDLETRKDSHVHHRGPSGRRVGSIAAKDDVKGMQTPGGNVCPARRRRPNGLSLGCEP